MTVGTDEIAFFYFSPEGLFLTSACGCDLEELRLRIAVMELKNTNVLITTVLTATTKLLYSLGATIGSLLLVVFSDSLLYFLLIVVVVLGSSINDLPPITLIVISITLLLSCLKLFR